MSENLETIRLLDNLVRTSNTLLLEANKFLSEFKLNWQHYKILDELCQSDGPKSSIELRQLFPGKRPDMTRLVDVLEGQGYITREINRENRRKIDITVTSKGGQVCQEVGTKLNRIMNLESKLSREDYGKMMDLLNALS